MTRKSAAKAKPIKVAGSDKFLREELPPIGETFDNIKQVIINTAEVSVVVAGRVENMGNLRAAAYKFWGNELDCKYTSHERMEYFKQLVGKSVGCYESIVEIIRGWELEEFLKEEMKDYFQNLMPKIEDIETENDLFEAMLMADIIKPWGEKMTQLHHQMLDEQAQRKAMEE